MVNLPVGTAAGSSEGGARGGGAGWKKKPVGFQIIQLYSKFYEQGIFMSFYFRKDKRTLYQPQFPIFST